MDGAKRSNYHIYVVCGVLLVLLGTRTIGYRFPMLESSGFIGPQHKCEICGKDATTTLNIGNRVHSLCEDHAKIDGAESVNIPPNVAGWINPRRSRMTTRTVDKSQSSAVT